MEPEKIDALFRQKMENFQKTPSADAWAKLQSRMEPKKEEKKPVMWLYYVAASVMLVLVSGIVWLAIRQENGTGTQLATTTKTEIQKPAEKQFELNGSEKEAQYAANQKGTVTDTEIENTAAGTENTDRNRPKNQARQLAAINNQTSDRNKNRMDKPVFEKGADQQKALANQKTKQLKAPVAKPENQALLAGNELKEPVESTLPAVNRETLEILIIKNAPETEMLAATETPEPADEDPLQSKFQLAKNIGKQLLNMKRGEKIDRTELGLPENYTVALETKILKQRINKTINL